MSFSDTFADFDLKAVRGDTMLVSLDFSQITGNVADYSIWFYGKLSPNDADSAAIVKCSTTLGNIADTSVPPAKSCQATIENAQTQSLTTTTVLFCEWQVKHTATGKIMTVDGSRGKLTIYRDIVQATA